MELIKICYKDYLRLDNTIATVGAFDGFHLGHLSLFENIFIDCKETKSNCAIITFDPHPDFILKSRENNGYLMSIEEKIKFCEEKGFDYFIVISFDNNLKEMNYIEFSNRFLKCFKEIIVGEDFKFGKNNEGNVQKLKELNINVKSIKDLSYNNQKLSSENVRELLKIGNVEDIKKILGHNFTMKGIVSKGSNIGHRLGFPTANLEFNNNVYSNIKNGVYITYVYYDNNKYIGATNIGNNPSINSVKNKRLEVHILDLDIDLYDKEIKVEFIKKIRDEIKFNSKEELIVQIKKDIDLIRSLDI